jgi:hypothetical protein
MGYYLQSYYRWHDFDFFKLKPQKALSCIPDLYKCFYNSRVLYTLAGDLFCQIIMTSSS